MISEPPSALAVSSPGAGRAGFWGSLGGLLSGTLLALIPLGLLALVLHLLHVLVLGPPTDGGVGWPWRIDSLWAGVADIAPRALLSLVLAQSIAFCLPTRPAAGLPARWPLALCAYVFSWPVSGRSDLLGLSGGAGFVAMWFVASRASGMRRLSYRPGRAVLATAAVTFCALAVVSVVYGTLNPLAAAMEASTIVVPKASFDPLPVEFYDRGPLGMRVLSVSTSGAPAQLGFSFGPLELPSAHEASSPAGLYRPVRSVRVAPGSSVQLWVNLRVPRGCSGTEDVSAITVRYIVAGAVRHAVIQLPSPTRVSCGANGS